MAARKRLLHDQKTREKIQTSQLINRLQNHVDGVIELSATQIRAAEILIRKTLPDLSSVEHSGEISTTATEMTEGQILERIAQIRAESRGIDTPGAVSQQDQGEKYIN